MGKIWQRLRIKIAHWLHFRDVFQYWHLFRESLGRTVAKWKLLSSPVFCFWLGYQHDYIYYCTYTNGFGLFSQSNSDLCLQMKVISESFIAGFVGLCHCTCALCCTGNRDRKKRVKVNPFTFIIWCTLPFKGLELVWFFGGVLLSLKL